MYKLEIIDRKVTLKKSILSDIGKPVNSKVPMPMYNFAAAVRPGG